MNNFFSGSIVCHRFLSSQRRDRNQRREKWEWSIREKKRIQIRSHLNTDIFISLLLKTQQKSSRKSSVVTRADWSLGSDVNNIVVFNTAALLFAGRFGFAPTVKKNYGGSTSYAMTEAAKPAVGSRDPAGFTAVDVLAFGSLAHIISAGEIFGMHMK